MRLEIADTISNPRDISRRYKDARQRLTAGPRPISRSLEPLRMERPDPSRVMPFKWAIRFNEGPCVHGMFGSNPWNSRGTHIPTFYNILDEVCRYYEIERTELVSDRRHKEVCLARQVVMYLAKELTRHSLPSIGRRLGGKDHTTVLHGIRRITALLASNYELAHDIQRLRASFGQS